MRRRRPPGRQSGPPRSTSCWIGPGGYPLRHRCRLSGSSSAVKTSPLPRTLLPTRVAVSKAARRGQAIWERSAGEREHAIAGMEAIVAGTPRAPELRELAQLAFIESKIDSALFWAQPWSAKVDARSTALINEALSGSRGVLLSSCHLGPYYRSHCAPPFNGHVTYLVAGSWFFEQPSSDYWGRHLARWRKGTDSRSVPANGSFEIVEALLRRGEPVFLFFDMPGPRETSFLGKPAMLADGTAQLAVRADALVLPLRARRVGCHAWVPMPAHRSIPESSRDPTSCTTRSPRCTSAGSSSGLRRWRTPASRMGARGERASVDPPPPLPSPRVSRR